MFDDAQECWDLDVGFVKDFRQLDVEGTLVYGVLLYSQPDITDGATRCVLDGAVVLFFSLVVSLVFVIVAVRLAGSIKIRFAQATGGC